MDVIEATSVRVKTIMAKKSPPLISGDLAARRKEDRQRKKLLRKQSVAGLKRSLHYDGDVPRCETCRHYRKSGSMLVDSIPRFYSASCTLHSFNVKPISCCDTWIDTAGNTLIKDSA